MNWKWSITHEVNDWFISNPYPEIGEEIIIKIRFQKNNEVKKVFFRILLDGEGRIFEMNKETEGELFLYYSIKFKIKEPKLVYYFIFETFNNDFYFYNKKGLFHYHPLDSQSFVILTDFDNPYWVPQTVFYQIFPDRFNCGDPENSIKSNEYIFDNYSTIKLNWDEKPLTYEKGHCLDFYGGDLQGIIDKIDYLKDLGINGIYINPIFEAKTNHKYDCIDYFNVSKYLGGNKALIKLTEELHKNNIRIIVDVSINHTGVEHHWFQKALQNKNSIERTFYYIDENNKYIGWEGNHLLPKLNYNSKELRKIIYEDENSSLVTYYLKKPFDIDGWRFDVGSFTGREGKDQFCAEIFKEIRKKVKNIKKDAYILAEQWEDASIYLQGDQWDGVMNYYGSGRSLKRFIGARDRFIENGENLEKDIIPYTGIDLYELISNYYSIIPNQLIFLQFNLIDSHDIYRLHNHKKIFNFDLYKGILIILFLLPGTPNIYYGDEIGLDGSMIPFEGCRYPMQWDDKKWNKDFLNFYKKLIKIKKNERSLHYGNYKFLYIDNETFVFCRFYKDTAFIGVLSKNIETKKIVIDISSTGISKDNIAIEMISEKEYKIINNKLELILEKYGNLLLKLSIYD